MGEYAEFNGERIKIGTCEDMYYLRFDQRHLVQRESGSVDPNGRNALGIRFRFPWPDEDSKQPGDFGDFDRSVTVPGFEMPEGVNHYTVQFSAQKGYLLSLPCPEGTPDDRIHRNGFAGAVRLVRQKLLADGRVVPVLTCGGCGAMWRLEDPEDIMRLAECFTAEGQRRKRDTKSASGEEIGNRWWEEIAKRILSYGLAPLQPA